MYIDDIKVFAKKKKWKRIGDPDTTNKNMHPANNNGIWQWNMFYTDNKKREKTKTEGILLLNNQRVRTLVEKEQLQVLGNIGSRHHQTRIKEKIRKEYLRRMRKFLVTKFCNRNFILGINTWVVLLVMYSRLFLKRTKRQESWWQWTGPYTREMT